MRVLPITIELINGWATMNEVVFSIISGIHVYLVREVVDRGLARWPVATITDLVPPEWMDTYWRRWNEAVDETGDDSTESVLRYWAVRELTVDDIQIQFQTTIPNN